MGKMAQKGNFWLGALVGWILMLILTPLLPVLGPLIGGFVAGLIAKGGFWYGGKAGFVAGIFGVIVVVILLLIGSTLLLGVFGFLTSLGIGLVLIVAGLYFALLGFLGGVIGGSLGK
jgi:hypothetical protein